ncbi:MAG: amidase [Gemmatimonadota bacterium]|nr:amidase [Gemmatimonadota bacterium]
MSRPDDPALWPAVDQTAAIRRGELSAVELLDACLGRVDRHDRELNALVTLDPEAREAAGAVDAALARGDDPGPLAGLVVGIKDVTEVAGLRTTYGSELFADHVPDIDALVVRRFREAGAVILGKTNTPEFAAGGNTWNDVFGVTRNPWDPSRSAGGSTGGGAAALATGMISIAQGTDLGGSLRIPASFCGIVGLRPTAGLIPTVPSTYLWDDLQVTGTMARTAEDIELSLRALAGPSPDSPVTARLADPDPRDPWEAGTPDGRRVAYCSDVAGIGVDPSVERVCREAAEALGEGGARVESIDLDLSGYIDAFLALRGHWFVSHFAAHADRPDDFGVNVAVNLRAGLELSAREIGRAESLRGRLREAFVDLFEDFDAILTPSVAIPPFPAEENYPREIAGRPMKTYIDWLAPTFLLSLPGLPVASVPAGLDPDGLPAGLQVAAPPFNERRALAVAREVRGRRPIGAPAIVSRD